MSATVLATMLLSIAPGDAPKPAPMSAMVLSLRGPVTIRPGGGEPRPARVGDPLRPGDSIAAPRDGEAAMVLLGSGRRARLKPGATAEVSGDAFRPAGAVELGESVPPIVRVHVKEAAPKIRGGRFAAGVFRGETGARRAPVSPTRGALVLGDRPALAWESVDNAESYRIQMRVAGDLKPRWAAASRAPRLEYPPASPALERGRKHEWTVTARTRQGDERTVAEGHFTVASAARVEAFAPVARLAKADDPADVLLAALTYQEYGAYDDALVAFERLSRLTPAEPMHLDAVADYQERAGRTADAAKARSRAEALRKGNRSPDSR